MQKLLVPIPISDLSLNKEEERLASLHRYAVLDMPLDAAVDRLTALAARLFEVPLALVSLVDRDHVWFKAGQGPAAAEFGCAGSGRQISREITFCTHAMRLEQTLVVPDACLDPLFSDSPLVTGHPGIRFYAGAPLIGADGYALGVLCLVDFQPRIFTAAQETALQDLAASIVSELDLRRSTAALAQSEQLYRQMFADNPHPMWVYDAETLQFLEVNDAAVHAYGYSRAEFLGMTLPAIRFPDDVPLLEAQLAHSPMPRYRSGVGRGWRHRTREGKALWVEVTSHAIQHQGRNARLVIAQDITARSEAEEALQRSLSVLKAQQEAALDGILVVDENRRIISYNQRLCELWHTPPEIIQSGDDERHLAHALSQLKDPEEFLRKVMYLYEHPSEFSRDEIEMRDGRIFDRYSGPIVSAEGKFHGRIWSFRDITERRQIEEALRQSERKLSRHLQQTPLAVIELSVDLVVTFWNAAAEAIFGYTAADALGQDSISLLVPETEQAYVYQVCRETTARAGAGHSHNYNRTKSGKLIFCEWFTTPLVDEQGVTVGVASMARDITEEQHAREELARSEARKTNILETALDCIISVDHTCRILEWNPAAERTFGYSRAEVLGRNFGMLIMLPSHFAALQQRIAAYLETGEGLMLNQRAEVYLRHRSGLEFPVEFSATAVPVDGLPVFTIYLRDVTDQKRLEAEREELLTQTEILLAEALERADRDGLTGLLNHRAFHKRLKEEIVDFERTGQRLAVLLLDLNDFKFFNDSYGHLAGDDVLKQVTQVLRQAGRPQDVLARFGGDEFALLMPGADRAAALHQAEEMHAAMALVSARPAGCELAIPFSVSLGIACCPEDGTSRTDLLEAAGSSLRVAKTGGEDENLAFHLRRDLSRSVGGFTMLDALVTSVDNKDRYTRRHSEDVLEYSVQIAQALGLDAKTQQIVKVAALLHDVGKIGVPDAVLRKPGKLTDDEYEAIKQHPLMGAIIVGAVAGFEGTLDAVRHHHERWDGQGYPFGLRGEEIPLMARLMAVADAYSAMTTDRPYRKGMAAERALSILEAGAGTQWDPECIHTFLRVRRTASQTACAAD